MATVLDTGLFESVSIVFTWLLLFLVTFGILEVTNFFKNRGVHAILAFVFAVLAGFSSITVSVVETMLPWFMVVAFFIFFMFLIGQFMGLSSDNILQALGGKPNAMWWILTIGFIIIAAALSQAFGQQLLEEGADGEGSSQSEVITTLTSPKVLGFFLLLLIGAFTVVFMASGGKVVA